MSGAVRDALEELHELLLVQAEAIERHDADGLAELVPALDAAFAALPAPAPGHAELAERAERQRADNERRLEVALAELGSRISRIAYGRTALGAYAPASRYGAPLRVVDHGA